MTSIKTLLSAIKELLSTIPDLLNKDIVITIKNPQIEGVKIGDEIEFRICKPLTK